MHDPVPEADGAYRVVFFNPAENVNQVSVLWLVNPGGADAHVTITGVDDNADSPGTRVRTTVPAGSSRRLSSVDLESGDSEAIERGALGDGLGKWRLRVVADQPLTVMSLLENPTGHLTVTSPRPRSAMATVWSDDGGTISGPPGNRAVRGGCGATDLRITVRITIYVRHLVHQSRGPQGGLIHRAVPPRNRSWECRTRATKGPSLPCRTRARQEAHGAEGAIALRW